MSFREWRQTYLLARGLTKPNGQMLFAYRTTANEYAELRQLFGNRLAALNGREWILSSVDECALFVLYAAEWWRRDYAGGPWRWMHILESLYDGQIQLPIFERNDAVERGMLSWGHKVGDEGKKYLGAIVAHGGLPLQMVAKGDGAITRLLYRATRSAQIFLWDDWRLVEFFREQDSCLVSHLRDPAIHRLLASIVGQVLALKREHRLGGLEHPVERLNNVLPSWRDRFPIQVDDAAVESLLVGLVKEAAQERDLQLEQPILADRILQASGQDEYSLVTAFRAPASLPTLSLAASVGLPDTQLPNGFALSLRSAGQPQALEVREQMASGGQRYWLSGKLKSIVGDQALDEATYDLVVRGEVIRSQLAIQGAEALDVRAPWIFIEQNQQLIMTAVGSAELPETSVWVSVPTDASWYPDDTESTCERIAQVRLTQARPLLRVTGSATVDIDGVDFRVRCGVAVAPPPKLMWRGRRVPHDSRPFPIYLGPPELCVIGEDGRLHPLSSQHLEWTLPGSKKAITNIRSYTGVADAWVLKDGRRARRYRLAIVPSTATVRFESGRNETEGVIQLQNWGVQTVHVQESHDLSALIESATGQVRLACTGQPPASVRVSIDWGGASPSTELVLPYPATGGRFLIGDAGRLPADATLSTRVLEQVRARVFDRNPSAPKSYRLHAELMRGRATEVSRRPVMLEYSVAIDSNGMGELRLLEVATQLRGIISQSDELDARIHLTLSANNRVLQSIDITRYDANLQRSGLDLSLHTRSMQQFSVNQLAGLQMLAQPIVAPTDEPRALTQLTSDGVPVGRWSLAQLSADEGPWLIYPAKDSPLQLRSIVFPGFSIGRPSSSSCGSCDLSNAMLMEDLEGRRARLETVIQGMATNWSHPSWNFLKAHHGRFRHLPLSTFDHWKVIGHNWLGLLACLAKLEESPVAQAQLARRIEDELGVMWDLMPKASAIGAISHSRDEFGALLVNGPTEVKELLLIARCKAWATAVPSIRTLIGCAALMCGIEDGELSEAGLALARLASKPIRKLLDELWFQEDCELQRYLLRPHAEDARWPDLLLCADLRELFAHQVPEAIQRWISTAIGQRLLWTPPDERDYRIDAACAPFIAALLLQLVPEAWRNLDSGLQARLRQVRSFAPDWFERSTYRALAISCQAPTY